jgi:uncharacterized membrane protein SpoIIM required for sporulation
MTPAALFEQRHQGDWQRLADLVGALESAKRGKGPAEAEVVLMLYRASCGHLALARSRDYPAHVVDRLDALCSRAHALIYRPPPSSTGRWRLMLAVELPQRLRRLGPSLALATAAFVLPLLVLGVVTWLDPAFALTVIPAEQLRDYESMYSEQTAQVGRPRGASDDWSMFGFYILHNIGISFQCFGSGLLAGLGSLFYLVYNGILAGAVAGYLAARGHAGVFFPFVVTHSAFELTAIVLSGAAGLHLGRALLWPGAQQRSHALTVAAREAVWPVSAAMGMLLIAAGLEGFWSPAPWVQPWVKYCVGGLCWALVLAFLGLQGRPRRGGAQP